MADLTTIPTKITCQQQSISGIHTPSVNNFDRIINDFPERLIPHFKPTNENKHREHHNITEGPPLHSRARHLDADKLSAAKAEFSKMEKLGIICRSNSPWASPLHIVRKPGGGWRLVAISTTSTLHWMMATHSLTSKTSMPTWQAQQPFPKSTLFAATTRSQWYLVTSPRQQSPHFWPMDIFPHALRSQQCYTGLPEIDG